MYFIHPENCELISLDPDTLVETSIPYTSDYVGLFSVVENRVFITNCEYAKLEYQDTTIPPGPNIIVLEYTNISEIEQLCFNNGAFISEKIGKMVTHSSVPISTNVADYNFPTLVDGFLLSQELSYPYRYLRQLNGTISGQTMHPLPICKFFDASIVPPE